MITLEDVRNNEEVEALIQGAQKQLDGLRIYRTQSQAYFNCFKKSRRNLGKIRISRKNN